MVLLSNQLEMKMSTEIVFNRVKSIELSLIGMDEKGNSNREITIKHDNVTTTIELFADASEENFNESKSNLEVTL